MINFRPSSSGKVIAKDVNILAASDDMFTLGRLSPVESLVVCLVFDICWVYFYFISILFYLYTLIFLF